MTVPQETNALFPALGLLSSTNQIFAALFFAVRPIFAAKNKTITIVPNEGLKFDGKTIPFKDLESIVERSNPAPGSTAHTKYLVIESYGTKIRLTDNLTSGIAKQLREEIIRNQK